MTAKKRILSILLALVMVLTLMPMTAGTVYAVDADTEPPEIDGSTLHVTLPEGKTEVTAGDSVTVSVKITDETGISSVTFTYVSSSSSTRYSYTAHYNAESDAYEIEIPVTEDTPSGVCSVLWIYASDVKGNNTSLTNINQAGNKPNADLSDGDFTVYGTNADTAPPEIDGSTLHVTLPEGKTEVTAGDSVTVSVKITDESGISSVTFTYVSSSSSTRYSYTAHYNAESDAYEIKIPVTEDTPSGVCSVLWIYASDAKGNNTSLTNVNQAGNRPNADLSAGDFTVYGTSADTAPPAIDGSTLHVTLPEGKTKVIAGDSVTVSIKITDESGISSVTFTYVSSSSSTRYSYTAHYNAERDVYEIEIPVTEDIPSGVCSVLWIYASDVKGNNTSLTNVNQAGNRPNADLSAGDFTVTENCKVTFHTDGGSEVAPQYVLAGEKAAEPEAPTKDGYVFSGWFSDETLTEEFDFETVVNRDVTLYAKWENAVTISIGVYDQTNAISGQGGTYTFNSEDMFHTADKHTVITGTTVEVAAAPADGYRFVGWCAGRISDETEELTIVPEGELGAEDPEGRFIAERDVVLCAVFKEITDMPPEIDISTLEVTLPEERQSDRVLTAGDRINVSVKITDNDGIGKGLAWFMLDHEANEEDPESYTKYQRVRLSEQENDIWTGTLEITEETTPGNWMFGYVEAEDQKNNKGGFYNSAVFEDTYSPCADLSALDFTVKKSYAVTFNTRGGSDIPKQKIISGKNAVKPADPTKENRYFYKWYTDENLTEEYWFGKPVNEDIILYAGWLLNAGIGIYNQSNPDTSPYNDSCGTIDITSSKEEYNYHIDETMNYYLPEEPASFKANPADGYTFKGWYEGVFGDSSNIEKPSNTLISDQNPYTPASADEAKALCAVFECAGHQYEQKIQKASPDQDGYKCDACRICGTEDKENVVPVPRVNNITLEKTSFTYTGKAVEADVKVTDADGKQLVLNSEYEVKYANNINPGTAKATVTLKGDYYEGTKELTFTITKPADEGGNGGNGDSGTTPGGSSTTPSGSGVAPGDSGTQVTKSLNPMVVKAKTVKIKYSKLSDKKQIIKTKKAFALTGAKGKVTYKVAKYDKKAKKKIKVSRTGKIMVKKGLKKGTYRLKIAVTAAGNANYDAVTKVVTLKVRVK